VSKIFRTSAAICTEVVLARSTGPNRPNCEFRVLLRHLGATALKRAKTSPRTVLEQTWLLHHDTAPSQTLSSPNSFWRKTKLLSTPLTVLPWFSTLWLLIQKIKLKLKGRQFLIALRRSRPNRKECLTLTEKDLQEVFRKWRRRWDRCLHAGGNYFGGDGDR
jgi:hypothetical protein